MGVAHLATEKILDLIACINAEGRKCMSCIWLIERIENIEDLYTSRYEMYRGILH
jgi:hypothetical protein